MSAAASTLAISAASCLALAACGGDSGSGTVSLPTPGIGNAKVNAVTSGDVATFAAGNAIANIIRHS